MTKWARRIFLLWVGWRLFGAEPQPKIAEAQEHPLRLPGRSVFVGDNEFFVREAGSPDAPPLLLVHGWGDHSLMVWWKLIGKLATRYRVIVPDNRNAGKSDHLRGRYEIADMAECNFRRIPPPRDFDDEMAGEPYWSIGPRDVFPEQFARFLVTDPASREVFLERHADLMDPAFWTGLQARLREGTVQDVFPYPEEIRFPR